MAERTQGPSRRTLLRSAPLIAAIPIAARAAASPVQQATPPPAATGRSDMTLNVNGRDHRLTIDSRTREVRVPRVVSAFAAGTIINPLTARSQCMGGVIWGLSSALHEATEIDATSARCTNDNLADYMVAVSADVPSVEVIMVPEHDDRVNPLGVKGIGEIGIVGMGAAVASAVFHATGKRLRELPIRLENLLS